MTAEEIIDLLHLAVWTATVACAPAIIAAMVIGTAIALLQALTQVQEATLTFVPKIAAVLLAILVSSTFIGASLYKLTEASFGRIAAPHR